MELGSVTIDSTNSGLLAEALAHNNKVTVVNLESAKVDIAAAVPLFQTNRSIETIRLSNTNIDDEGADKLGEAILANENCSIDDLWLDDNQINEGAGKLVRALKDRQRSLHCGRTRLWLGKNAIDDSGARVIASALRDSDNYGLDYLNLQDNPITGVGARSLHDAISPDDGIEISLVGNRFDPETTAMLRGNGHFVVGRCGFVSISGNM
uniref:Uncharacterized protein n=1 Tax=Grammatophora oceanica TaxID=210454 RepID=A0A7S1VQE0_9STRA